MDASQFLRDIAKHDGRIVSSNDLTQLQIAEAQACGRFYVDEETSYGWAILPWELSTFRDEQRK